MFGKIFESMYEGSMVGAGCPVFAVWGYVIAKMQPDKEVGAQVDLNPQLLAMLLGAKESEVEGAIRKLCAPDPRSRSPEEEGKRLVRLGQFAYRVVNGAKYMEMRHEEDRRRQNRESQARRRARKLGKPLPGEAAYVKALEDGDEAGAERVLSNSLPAHVIAETQQREEERISQEINDQPFPEIPASGSLQVREREEDDSE